MKQITKVQLTLSLLLLLVLTLFALISAQIDPKFNFLAYFLLVLLLVPGFWYVIGFLLKDLDITLTGLETGLLNFKDNDFSVSIPVKGNGQLTRIAQVYNQVGEILRQERQSIYQRELLLDKVIQSSPLSMVLTDDHHRVLYSNIAARHLFNQGKRFEGLNFDHLIAQSPPSLSQTIRSGKDGLCSVDVGEEAQTYHVSQSQFLLNAKHHRLYLFKQLTRELNRQEVAIWKKVIRVISHELNNSLAPMSSMAHSGKLLAKGDDKLNLIFETIAERVTHLNEFIQGYAKFSKLPLPQRKPHSWQAFCASLQQHWSFTVKQPLPTTPVNMDGAQMEQVLINLLKNAVESGSKPEQIELSVEQQPQQFILTLSDRGCGMSQAVLQSALLPFYSTKQTGTGLGLPLCREIVEAHEGKMGLNNRAGGGLTVTLWLGC